MKITYRKVLYNDCWLNPWIGFVWKVKRFKNGIIEGAPIINGKASHFIELNGYMDKFSRPIKIQS